MGRHLTLVLSKGFLILGIGLIAVYLGLFAALRLWQTRLIFFPPPASEVTPAELGLPYEEVWLPAEIGNVSGWWIPAPQAKAPVILYFYGNGSNTGNTLNQAARFNGLGLSVLLIDYRGYGNSIGPFPSEASVYEDAEAAWLYLTQTRQIAHEDIFLYGHSLGGAIAIELATRYPQVAGVIVEGTFTSIRAMVDYQFRLRLFPAAWVLTQHFDSLAKVRSLQVPILVIHGTADRIVPTRMSQELYTAALGPKQLMLVPEAGHNNVDRLGGAQYLQTIQAFIQKSKEGG